MPHQLTNYKSIKCFNEIVDSVVIPPDLTMDETKDIIDRCGNVSIFGFGLMHLMYSKRLLLSNYAEFNKLNKREIMHLSINDKTFLAVENNLGCVFYAYPFFKNVQYDSDNLKYILINSLGMSSQELNDLLNGSQTNLEITDGFLNKKTIYKLKEKQND